MKPIRCRSIFTAGVLTVSLTCTILGCSDEQSDWESYEWQSMGSPGAGPVSAFSMAMDPSDDKPVIVYQDIHLGEPLPHALKWDSGTSWVDLGYPNPLGEGGAVAIDPSDNKPVVVVGADAVTKKWSGGTTWTDLGSPWASGPAIMARWQRMPSGVFDPSDDKPLVVYADSSDGEKVHVAKWSTGTSWNDMGAVSSGVGGMQSIVLDPSDNKPVVVFVDMENGTKAHVKKWSSGTTWVDLGYPSPHKASVMSGPMAITIDPSDNNPIVAVEENPYGEFHQVRVMKWSSGTSWTDLGYPSDRTSEYPVIIVDPTDGRPIVAFRDWEKPIDAGGTWIHVRKWTGGTSWVDRGYPRFADAHTCSIAIDPSDNKPIVIQDCWEDGRVYVSKHP